MSAHFRLTKQWLVASLVALSLPLLFCGCGGEADVTPELLSLDSHASGDHQAGLYGAQLEKPFRVVLEGAVQPGRLGGKGSRPVAPGIEVRFRVLNPQSGALFVASQRAEAVATSDAGGTAEALLKLGSVAGDVDIEADLPAFPGVKPVRFRAMTGIEKIGKDLESSTGGTIEQVGVRLLDQQGRPVSGVEVFFRAEGCTEGAALKPPCATTDADGMAVASWKLGKKVQQYFAGVEIHDTRPSVPESERFTIRSITFKAMGSSKKEMLLVLFGGLGIFIYGMKLMSDGLKSMADRRLKDVLHFMTQNRFMAVGAGVLITAMIQSSSATTVMTVGFVNAGLMSLAEAIGVIFGANIGTTVTAQIIAFKLDSMAYPAIAVGLVMMTMLRRPQLKALGQAILGFGLLFLGMKTMGGILKPLRYSPEFVAWFQLFDCSPLEGSGFVRPWPALMCILIGTVTTVVVQSSSATVGLVLALSSQGLISFYTAVPLILGDNIGTTVTANLAAIGTNRNARRTALAHTMFNVFGAVYMYLLLFVPLWGGQPVFLGLVDWFTPGVVFSTHPENLLRHVANAHTAFNVFNVILFIPFTGVMARVCQKIIPVIEADHDRVLQYLEPKLLQTPSIALEQAVNEVAYMVRQGQKSMNESCELLCGGDESKEKSILDREELIDRLQAEITEYLVELSRRQVDPAEALLIPALIHAVNDAERVGDHAEDLVELHTILKEKKHKLSKKGERGLRQFQERLNQEFDEIFTALTEGDSSAVERALKIDAEQAELLKELTDAHVKRVEKGKCDIQSGVAYLDALSHLERVGDHLLNIAERAAVVREVA